MTDGPLSNISAVEHQETGPSRLPKKLRRQQLLISALRVFSSQGYHNTTMNHIASVAEVTKPVLYQHFRSKQELYLAVLDEQIADLTSQLTAPLHTVENNQQKVREVIHAFFEFTRTNPQGYRFIFASDVHNDAHIKERIEQLYTMIASSIADVLAPNAGMSKDDATLISRSLVGMVLSAAQQGLKNSSCDEDLKVAENLVYRLAWGGISIIDEDLG